MTRLLMCIALLLTGCGGSNQPTQAPKAQFSVGPQLRPCETTAPGAPPCPASQ